MSSPRLHSTLVAGLVLALSPMAAGKTAPCPAARYLIDTPQVPWLRALSLDAGRFTLVTTCARPNVVRSGRKDGRKIKATLAACPGVTGTVHLDARMDAACAVLSGKLRVPHQRPKAQAFSAPKSTCGDGRLDSTEQCDPPAGCGTGFQCDGECHCVPTVIPPSVTTTTRIVAPATSTTTTTTSTTLGTPCDGCPPGAIRLNGADTLEFGAVATGASRTISFFVGNGDDTPQSQLHVTIGTDRPGFDVVPHELLLGPSESQQVDMVFAPGTAGHQSTVVTIASNAPSRPFVYLLAHGFGGDAPDTGPTLAADPLFYSDGAGGLFGILASGKRFVADNGAHACLADDNTGTLDLCTSDDDCVTAGEHCAQSSTCIGGARAGEVCAIPDDCPGGICRSFNAVDPVDMCGDGTGGLYLMTDFGTFTDPNPGDTERDTSVVHLQFDPATGARTAASIVARVTDGTTQIACDRIAAGSGGQVYVPRFFDVVNPRTDCSRDSREALTSFAKDGTRGANVVPDVDAALGYAECDDFDAVTDLQVTPTASAMFVSLFTGLYRLRPAPALLITPDIFDDSFQVHPDGSILYVTATDAEGTGTIRLYKIAPDQASQGLLHLASLTPCATYQVPNNRTQDQGVTFVEGTALAVDRPAPGSPDAVVLVSFFTTGGGQELPFTLRAQGTIAIASPAGSNTCSVLGLVNLDFLDPLTF